MKRPLNRVCVCGGRGGAILDGMAQCAATTFKICIYVFKAQYVMEFDDDQHNLKVLTEWTTYLIYS